MTTTMGVKLERETRERLKALGKSKDRTPHWLVKKAIDEYLAREEEWEREIAEDRERFADFQKSGESYTLEEVTGWMAQARAGKKARWPR